MLPDPSLGITADGFDETVFRNAIKATMQLGSSPDPNKRPKFVRKAATKQYFRRGETTPLPSPPRMGRDGEPLDPEIEVRAGTPVILEVPKDLDCAVEIELADADELPVGNFRRTKAVVTFLDVDYAKIAGCKEMTYNGDRYLYGYEPEALGLFGVGVHTIIWYALDES